MDYATVRCFRVLCFLSPSINTTFHKTVPANINALITINLKKCGFHHNRNLYILQLLLQKKPCRISLLPGVWSLVKTQQHWCGCESLSVASCLLFVMHILIFPTFLKIVHF